MPGLWGVPEWEFFLDDLAKHLAPRGRVWLELNQEYDGTFYTPELKDLFEKRGAKINEYKIMFNGWVSPGDDRIFATADFQFVAIRVFEEERVIARAVATTKLWAF